MVQLFKSFSNFKKHFSSVFSFNKKVLILGISLALFLCIFNFQYVEASVLGDLYNKFKDIFNYIITLPIRLPFIFLAIIIVTLGLISQLIFFLVGSLLSWLIGITLDISVISGWVVTVGFEFTKNFANMLIILILAFIGLATILKIREYEARKILPKLIMVALLINFTPVMVGFIVDIANLFTNFFFTEIINSGALTGTDVAFDMLSGLTDVISVDIKPAEIGTAIGGTLVPILLKGIIMILFYNFAAFVYFLVFLLFFVRLIILWVLVILAPIAFFSQILPEGPTVKALFPNILHWNKWWETLVQWAFIGVPLGFFLYLSAWIIKNSGGMPLGSDKLDTGFNDIIISILAPTISMFILIVGIIISTESMPGIAKGIVSRAKGVGAKAGGFAKGGLRRAVLTERGGKLMEKAAKFQGFLPKLGKWGEAKGVRGKAAWIAKGAAKTLMAPTAFPLKHAIRRTGRKSQELRAEIPGLIDQEMKDEKLQAFVKKGDWKGLAGRYTDSLATPERKTAIATLLAKHRGKKGLGELDKLKPDLSKEATRLAMQQSPSHAKTIIAADPQLASLREVWTKTIDPTDKRTKRDMEKVRKSLEERGEVTEGRDLEEIIAAGDKDEDYIKIAGRLSSRNTVKGLSLSKIEDLTYETFDNPEFQEDFVITKGVKFIAKVDEVIGPEITEKLRAKIKEVGAETLAVENPTLLRSYFTSPLRDVLGTSLERPDTKEKFKDIHGVNDYIDTVKKQAEESREQKPPTIPLNMFISESEITSNIRETRTPEETAELLRRTAGEEADEVERITREINTQRRPAVIQSLIEQNQELMSSPESFPKIARREGTQEQRQSAKKVKKEGEIVIKKINENIKELQTLSQAVRSTRIEGLTEAQEDALATQREEIQDLKIEILADKTELTTTINEFRALKDEMSESRRESARQAVEQIQEREEE